MLRNVQLLNFKNGVLNVCRKNSAISTYNTEQGNFVEKCVCKFVLKLKPCIFSEEYLLDKVKYTLSCTVFIILFDKAKMCM